MTDAVLTPAPSVAERVKADIGPVEAAERIEVLDILRGVAIFGILVVNMTFFAQPMLWRLESPWGPRQEVVYWLIAFFFQGKFYSLFSFLFGLGLAVQMSRAEDRNTEIGPIYRRRIFVLLLIGIIHAVFIWFGDILHQYALLGFLLMLFRKRQPRAVARWIFISLAIPIVLFLAVGGFLDLARTDPAFEQRFSRRILDQKRELREEAAEALQAYSNGTYEEVLQQRLKDLARIDSFAIFFLPHVFALFLTGLYAGKRRILHDMNANLPFIRKVWTWGLIIGLGNIISVIGQETSDPMIPTLRGVIYNIFYVFGAPALSFFYASSIVLATLRPGWKRRLMPLAAVGQMALSNYLLQSLICTTIFYSHGLGLFGKVPPSLGFLLALVIFALQIPLSVWWLRRFRFGPAEWLWRSLTYGRRQPMRLVVPA